MTAAPARTPYFLRAMYEWIGDSGLTPHLIVDARVEGVRVPESHADARGRIVLNIGAEAVRDLDLANDAVTFGARFGGVAHSIYLPMASVLGIYARETGEGIAFSERSGGETGTVDEPEKPTAKQNGRPQLKVVK